MISYMFQSSSYKKSIGVLSNPVQTLEMIWLLSRWLYFLKKKIKKKKFCGLGMLCLAQLFAKA